MTPHEGPSAILPDDWVCLELAGFGPSSSAGHAHFSRAGVGYLGLCPAFVPAAGHVRWRGEGAGGMSHRGVGERGACPVVGGAWACPFIALGTAEPERWAVLGDYVQPSCRPRGMSRGGVGERGACPFFAVRTGLCGTMSSLRAGRGACPVVGWGSVGHAHFSRAGLGLCGTMSSPRMQEGACPPEKPQTGRGGPNWAKLESSGILVSAFDSEATGEFA